MAGYKHLLEKIQKNPGVLVLARVKNGFNKKSGDGYRDLKVNVQYNSKKQSISMIGEIQFLLLPFLRGKKKSHKLYGILRREPFYRLVVTADTPVSDTSNNNNKYNQVVGKEVSLQVKYEIKSNVRRVYNAAICEELNLMAILSSASNVDSTKQTKIEFVDIDIDQKIKNNDNDNDNKININNKMKKIESNHSHDDKICFYKFNKLTKVISSFEEEYGYSLIYTQHLVKSVRASILYWTPKKGGQNILIDLSQSGDSWGNAKVETFIIDKFNRITIMLYDTKGKKVQIRNMNNINLKLQSIDLSSKIFSPLPSIDNNNSKYGCFTSHLNNTFQMFDIDNGNLYQCISNKLGKISSSVFIDNTNFVVFGGIAKFTQESMIEIWDKVSRKAIRSLNTNLSSGVSTLFYFNNLLYAASFDGELIVVNTKNNWQMKKLNTKLYNNPKIQLSQNGKYLAVAGEGCRVFNME